MAELHRTQRVDTQRGEARVLVRQVGQAERCLHLLCQRKPQPGHAPPGRQCLQTGQQRGGLIRPARMYALLARSLLAHGPPGLDHRQAVGREHLPRFQALQLAAGGARQACGAHQDDRMRVDLMRFHHGLADGGEYGSRIQVAQRRAGQAVDNDEPFLRVMLDPEGDGAVGRQGGMAVRDRRLDVLGVEVAPANDDQVLDAAEHEQLAIDQRAQIAGAQERTIRGIIRTPRAKRCRGTVRALPVAAGDGGAGDPDFADIARRQHLPGFRMDDVDGRAIYRRTVRHGGHAALRSRRRRAHAAHGGGRCSGGRCSGVHLHHARFPVGQRQRHLQRGFGQAIGRPESGGAKPGRGKAAGETLQGCRARRLSAHERMAHGGQIERACGIKVHVTGQLVAEVRTQGERGPVVRQGLDPARGVLQERRRYHHDGCKAGIDRLQQPGDQAQVVIGRQPCHHGVRRTQAAAAAGSGKVCHQVVVPDHHPLGRAGRARGVLKKRQIPGLRRRTMPR